MLDTSLLSRRINPARGQLYLNADCHLSHHLIALFHSFDGDMRDISPYQHQVTRVDASGDLTRAVGDLGRTDLYSSGGTADRYDLGSITSANPLSLVGQTELAALMWLHYTDNAGSNFPRIIDKSNGGSGANGWYIDIDESGGGPNPHRVEININNSGAGNTIISGGDYVVPDETRCYVININISGDSGDFYRDGMFFGGDASSANLSAISSTTTNAAIGHWNHNTTDRRYSGNIYAIALFNRLLTEGEIYSLYEPATRWQLFDQISTTAYSFAPSASADTTVSASTDALALTTYQATVDAPSATVVNANVDALTLTTYAAFVGEACAYGADFEGKNINESSSVITDASTTTPDITIVPYLNTTEGQGGGTVSNKFWNFCANFSGCDGKTPEFTVDMSSAWVNGLKNTTPQWTSDINDIDSWAFFDNATVATDTLTFSNNAAFSDNVIYVALCRSVTNSVVDAWLDQFADHPYMHKPRSVKAFSGTSQWAYASVSSATDDNGLSIPAQEQLACRVTDLGRHPSDGEGKRKAILITSAHASEDLGTECFLRAVEYLMDASPVGTAEQQAAYRLVRDYDWYCYGTVNPGRYRHHVYGYSNTAQSGDDYQPNTHWDDTRPFSETWHESVADAIDVDLPNGTAHVLLDFHAQTSGQEIWGDATDPDLVDYEAAVDDYVTISPQNTANAGAARTYARTEWSTTHSYAYELGFASDLTLAEVKSYGRAALRGLDDLFTSDMAQTAVSSKVSVTVTNGNSLTGIQWALFDGEDVAFKEPAILSGTAETTTSGGLLEVDTTGYLEVGQSCWLALTNFDDDYVAANYEFTGGMVEVVAG